MEQKNGEAGLLRLMADTLTVSKKNAAAVATEIKARIADKRVDVLRVVERFRFIAAVSEAFEDDTTKAQITEALKERSAGTGKVMMEGGVFAERETGTKYDYSGDQAWSDLDKLIKVLSEDKKNRETFLKTLPATMTQAYRPIQLVGQAGPPAQSITITVKPPTKKSVVGFAYTMNAE